MEERVSLEIRRLFAQRFGPLYRQTTEPQKKQILAAFLPATGYHPRYGKWVLSHSRAITLQPRASIPRRYGPEVQQALEVVWNAANRIYSKRLIPFLSSFLEALEYHGEIHLTSECRALLLTMSASTADRLLSAARSMSVQGLSTTRAGTLLKQQIPRRISGQWSEAKPGFLEEDLVAHCGKGQEGTFL